MNRPGVVFSVAGFKGASCLLQQPRSSVKVQQNPEAAAVGRHGDRRVELGAAPSPRPLGAPRGSPDLLRVLPFLLYGRHGFFTVRSRGALHAPLIDKQAGFPRAGKDVLVGQKSGQAGVRTGWGPDRLGSGRGNDSQCISLAADIPL